MHRKNLVYDVFEFSGIKTSLQMCALVHANTHTQEHMHACTHSTLTALGFNSCSTAFHFTDGSNVTDMFSFHPFDNSLFLIIFTSKSSNM